MKKLQERPDEFVVKGNTRLVTGMRKGGALQGGKTKAVQ